MRSELNRSNYLNRFTLNPKNKSFNRIEICPICSPGSWAELSFGPELEPARTDVRPYTASHFYILILPFTWLHPYGHICLQSFLEFEVMKLLISNFNKPVIDE